jgi:hypothetical protein
MAVQSVTYNSVNLTRAGSKITPGTSGNRLNVELWYLLNANLPAAGTYDVNVTYTGDVNNQTGGAISVANAAQSAPGDVNTAATIASPISTTVNCTAGSLVIDAVGCGNESAFTPVTAGMVERYDIQSTNPTYGCTGAGSTTPVAAAGTATIQWSNSSVNRMAQVAASFAKTP